MKNTFATKTLTRSIMSLFDTKKQLPTYKRIPDAYYKHVYISKNLYDGIELVAKIEGISKKKATDFLLEAGFSRYMGNILKGHVENEQKIKKMNLRRHPYPTHFIKELRKFAQKRGIDTSKIT